MHPSGSHVNPRMHKSAISSKLDSLITSKGPSSCSSCQCLQLLWLQQWFVILWLPCTKELHL